MIRTRFAPSPTGFLHVGGLRTALFAYLLAKSQGGEFLLRIEDTDRQRLVDGATEQLVHALRWAGIEPDEGVLLDGDTVTQRGEKGPYIQSERLEIYKEHVEKLLESGNAYYAFDSAEELDAMRETQQAAKQQIRYDRDAMKNSFTLSEEEVEEKKTSGSYVIRLMMPREGETSFTDMIRGEVTFKNELIDDQVLLKSDGFPTYHLAVVVDDHHMNITHVVRGEEWISSTPKHIELYKAFGWDAPTYAHLPLLVNEKKQKLSKRHGDVSVEDFKEAGFLPEALVNFVALLGWNPGDEREIFSLKQLGEVFKMEQVGKSPAVFNREKLLWYNSHYIREMDVTALAAMLGPYFVNAGLTTEEELQNNDFISWLESAVALEQERSKTLNEFPEHLALLFAKELDYADELLVWRKGTREEAKDLLEKVVERLETHDDWSEVSLEELIMPWVKENDYGVGNVLWPLRVSLSGKKNSPGPFELLSVLGKEKSLGRIGDAIERLS